MSMAKRRVPSGRILMSLYDDSKNLKRSLGPSKKKLKFLSYWMRSAVICAS